MWATSKSTATELVSLGFSSERIHVIHDGLDSTFFKGPLSPTKNPRVLYVGRLRKYKGLVDPLLKAWKEVIYRKPDAKLQIVGKGVYEEKIKREIENLGLTRSVEMLGFVNETLKRDLMRSAWFLVYPSRKEGWGLSVIEAASVGIPTIASRSPGLSEAVKDGVTGLLVKHGDVDALANGILHLIEDNELRQRMGAAAKEWSQNFDWDVMQEQILEWILGEFPKLRVS
jgi:glycosyltransferase involved in cell wall biosynthesis